MRYYIKQIGTKDCAMACLKMLLSIIYKSNKFLYYPQSTKDAAYSLQEIINYADLEGVTLNGFKYNDKKAIFNTFKYPKLCVMNNNGILHMVLVRKYTNRNVLVYDPKNEPYWISKKNFIENWNGETLEVDKVRGSNYKNTFKSPISIFNKIMLVLLQLLSAAFALLAMFFVNSQIKFVVPVILFSAFAITEIVYKRFLIVTMKKFDIEMIDKIYDSNSKLIREKIEDINKFKILAIGKPIEIINSLVILFAGMTIIGINAYLNILNILLIITIRTIFDIVENRYFLYKQNNTNLKEQELLMSRSKDEFKERFSELQKQVYIKASFLNYKNYIIIFLIGIITLVYSAFANEISINFIIFHIFIYYYISNGAAKLLKIYLHNDEYIHSKCLFKYYCNDL